MTAPAVEASSIPPPDSIGPRIRTRGVCPSFRTARSTTRPSAPAGSASSLRQGLDVPVFVFCGGFAPSWGRNGALVGLGAPRRTRGWVRVGWRASCHSRLEFGTDIPQFHYN